MIKTCLAGVTHAVTFPTEDNPSPEHHEPFKPLQCHDVWDLVFEAPFFTFPDDGSPKVWGWAPE